MPYQAGARLQGELASKLGHLEVLKSDLVNKLCRTFESTDAEEIKDHNLWQPIPMTGKPLPIIFGIDGSLQIIQSETPPYKAIAFVKTALLRLDQQALSKVDKNSPHPFALRDILKDAALYHATAFPLRHVKITGFSLYNAIRRIIFDSINDASLNGEPLKTLKWLAYEKWDGVVKPLPEFDCPHCEKKVATLPYDADQGQCPNCQGELYVTDMLGFHLDMAPDSAPDIIASTYMRVHETLLLFTGIRHFWEKKRAFLEECLFCSDGPLSIRAQYSKLVAPIRRFLNYAQSQSQTIYMLGQEKTGYFVEHLDLIASAATSPSVFIPSNSYIKTEIQNRPDVGAPYGQDTNYGAKVFVKINSYHHMVLNIPTSSAKYVPDPDITDLLGADRIWATLPQILSNRYEGAILPLELANGVASLSTYPSARILKVFADSLIPAK